MSRERSGPDLEFSFPLSPHAPRNARLAVAGVDRPSPDLRDAVMLMISDIVTRAVLCHGDDSRESATVRVWMPAEVARVEVWTRQPLFGGDDGQPDGDYELIVLRQSADRWASSRRGHRWCTWFEIDRHEAPPVGAPRDRQVQHA